MPIADSLDVKTLLTYVTERDDGTFHARDFKFDIDPSFRALYWLKLSARTLPEPGKSYLIRSWVVGPVYDVAFFNGRRPDGSLWWTVTNIEIDHPLRGN